MANKRFWLGMLVMVLVFGMTVVGCAFDSTQDVIQGKWQREGTIPIGGAFWGYDFRDNWMLYRTRVSGLGLVGDTERIHIAIARGSGQIARAGVAAQPGQTHHILYYFEIIGEDVMRKRTRTGSWFTLNRVDRFSWE